MVDFRPYNSHLVYNWNRNDSIILEKLETNLNVKTQEHFLPLPLHNFSISGYAHAEITEQNNIVYLCLNASPVTSEHSLGGAVVNCINSWTFYYALMYCYEFCKRVKEKEIKKESNLSAGFSGSDARFFRGAQNVPVKRTKTLKNI